MKKTTFLLLLVLVLFSCKKKTYITIQAENYITGEGSDYAGATYYVVESYTPLFEVKSKQVATGTLDENGHAAFEIKANGNRKYKISLTQPENVCYTTFRNYQSLDEGADNVFNFKYGTCGYLNFQYNSVFCEGPNDKFQYKYYTSINSEMYFYTGFTTGADNNWSENTFLDGCRTYLGDYSKIIPVGPYEIAWRVIRGTDTTYGTDTFYINENDTTTYLIEY